MYIIILYVVLYAPCWLSIISYPTRARTIIVNICCIIPIFLAENDLPEHTTLHVSTGGNQTNQDKPRTPEGKQSPTLNDKTVINKGAISSSNSMFCYLL